MGVGMAIAAAGTARCSAFAVDGEGSLLLISVASIVISIGLAPVITLATELIVGSAPPEQAGAATGISETSGELGGALGIAILGSIGTAVYRSEVADSVPPGIPAEAADAARDTLGGALAIAESLPGAVGDALVLAAQTAFVDALHFVAAVAVVGAAITAIIAAGVLWTVPARAEPDAETDAGRRRQPAGDARRHRLTRRRSGERDAQLLGAGQIVDQGSAVVRSQADRRGAPQQLAGEAIVIERMGGLGPEDQGAQQKGAGRVRDIGQGRVHDPGGRLRVDLRMEQQARGGDRLAEARLRRRHRVGTRFERLANADDVPAGIGHQELTHAVRHVTERAEPRHATGRNAPQPCLEARPEVGIEAVDVADHDVAGAVRVGGLVALHHEEVELDRAPLRRRRRRSATSADT